MMIAKKIHENKKIPNIFFNPEINFDNTIPRIPKNKHILPFRQFDLNSFAIPNLNYMVFTTNEFMTKNISFKKKKIL